MIWLILAGLLALVLVFVFAPLLQGAGPARLDTSEALNEARQQLARLEGDLAAGRIGDEVAAQTRRALELRVLDLLDNGDAGLQTAGGEPSIRVLRVIVPLFLIAGSFGLYVQLGQPNFEKMAIQDQSLETLVVSLERKLSSDPNPPAQGYVLLARSLMTLERYDDAFAAYERALALDDGGLQVADEYQRARVYAASVNAQAMSDEDRAAMITGMVEGLAARLEADPKDAEGWARLIRARVVLGQTQCAQTDVATALAAFEGDAARQAELAKLAAELGLTPR